MPAYTAIIKFFFFLSTAFLPEPDPQVKELTRRMLQDSGTATPLNDFAHCLAYKPASPAGGGPNACRQWAGGLDVQLEGVQDVGGQGLAQASMRQTNLNPALIP